MIFAPFFCDNIYVAIRSVTYKMSCSFSTVDSGGVLRQFYSDLFEGLVQGKLLLLFEGEEAHKVPGYQPQAVMSGMFEMVGKRIAHSLVMTSGKFKSTSLTSTVDRPSSGGGGASGSKP